MNQKIKNVLNILTFVPVIGIICGLINCWDENSPVQKYTVIHGIYLGISSIIILDLIFKF